MMFCSMSAGVRSVELQPAAAISILLYSGGEQLQVRGPIQISLPLGHGTRLRAADTMPAWAFNLQTGETADHTELHEAKPQIVFLESQYNTWGPTNNWKIITSIDSKVMNLSFELHRWLVVSSGQI